MADLKFVDQHNMVACLEKTEENAEFHQIVNFLSSCSITYALTVSPTIYASYIVQFWNTATSKTFNSMKQIHVIVDGKAMVISESSVRSDLLFNDADGIACLTNDEIFENLALMGYEQLSTKLTFQKAPEGEGSAISPEPQPTSSTSQANVSEPQTESLQTETPPPVTVLGAKKPWGALAQTRSERVLENTNEPPIPEGHISRSGEGSMEHTFELTNNVPNTPHDSPLSKGYTPGSDEEEAKTAQDRVITRLKLRVKRLEKKRKVRTLQPIKRRLFKGRVESSDDDLDEEDASKQGRIDDKTKPMFQESEFDELDDDMDNVEGETVNTATTGVSVVSAPVTTAGVAISNAEPRTPPTTVVTAFIDEDLTIA
ncbi:hypothetical protein Tco_1553574 [Tanacetum coccineum]